jgi:hypothetical protein
MPMGVSFERRLTLFGMRGYLIAREIGTVSQFRQFRLDRISQAVTLPGSFARDAGFDLRTYASRAFGSYHSDAEYGPVEWKFAPVATAVARGFVFHPDQEVETNLDGTLTVRFAASGWLEMAWHLSTARSAASAYPAVAALQTRT